MKELEKKNSRLRRAVYEPTQEKLLLQEAAKGTSVPRATALHRPIRSMWALSKRRVCFVLGQRRSTQRAVPCRPDDAEELTAGIIALARRYGRYGCRRITVLLHEAR